MKFSLSLYTSLLALCLTFTTLTSATVEDSIRLPLRKRSSSIHRSSYLHGRSDLPICDFKQLDRRLVQIENRYSRNPSNSTLALKHKKHFLEKWSEDFNDVVENFFDGEKETTDDDDVGGGLLDDKTSHSPKGSQLVNENDNENEVPTLGNVNNKKVKKQKNKQVKSNAATEKLSNQVSAGQDIEFFAQVTVGTPGQTFNVNPDSGSADFWVVSNQCKSKTCSHKSEKFDSSKSSTYSANGNKDFQLTYGIGGVSGSFFRDTVSVSGIQISNQTVAQASKLSKDYRTDQAEGVMGLGFRSITSGKEIPILQRLFTQHQFPKQLIGFSFGRTGSNTIDKSEMSIGSINNGLIKGDLHYTPVTKQGFWQFSFDSLFVGNDKGTNGIDGIVDTGTSSIAMPVQQAKDFHNGVKGSSYDEENGYFTFPCSQEINATFKLKDGTEFKINSDDMNLGRDSDGSKKCVSAVMAADTGGVVVFGLSLLKNAYTVLDYENKQIGFASYNF